MKSLTDRDMLQINQSVYEFCVMCGWAVRRWQESRAAELLQYRMLYVCVWPQSKNVRKHTRLSFLSSRKEKRNIHHTGTTNKNIRFFFFEYFCMCVWWAVAGYTETDKCSLVLLLLFADVAFHFALRMYCANIMVNVETKSTQLLETKLAISFFNLKYVLLKICCYNNNTWIEFERMLVSVFVRSVECFFFWNCCCGIALEEFAFTSAVPAEFTQKYPQYKWQNELKTMTINFDGIFKY